MIVYIIFGLTLFSLASYFIYTKSIKKASKAPIIPTQQTPVERCTIAIINSIIDISLEELSEHDGEKKPTIYIGVKGVVFDVTKSGIDYRKFLKYIANYKKGASYDWLAGKEASVGLAKMSSDEKYFNSYEKIKLTKEELESLDGWVNYMKQRYPIVGYVSVSKKEK